ncbi:MAG: nucleoside phosphorylase [Bacteroidales bacterium]|nr:nucleoside phosphorylase [Bacteroidales bacterium]
MPLLAEPDLIVNADGSVYHLCMKPQDLADIVIVVGDPNRVKEISEHFTHIDHRAGNREFISATGYYHGKRITALSTGIGTDNCDIVMHELDALANFDLKTRVQKPAHRTLSIIRIGTSGSIQPDVPIGSFGLSTHAVGLDNLLHFYKGSADIIDQELTAAFAAHADWPVNLSRPYFIKGSDKLVDKFRPFSIPGITVTAPGFYGPQGRFLRLPLTDPDMIRKLQSFRYKDQRIINFEMETSALYGLGALMGFEMVTVCALIANRATGQYLADHKQVVRGLINLVLETIVPA